MANARSVGMRTSTIVLGTCLSLCVGLAGRADAEPVKVRAGKVVLPITGLAVELPRDPRKSATWLLSGSWSLSNGGSAYDGRDVIDQHVGGKLVRGDWIHTGYYDVGDCAAVVKDAALTERWDGEADLYGEHFQVGAGIFDLGEEIGKIKTLVLCTQDGRGKALLLYHYFVAPGAPTGKAGLPLIAKDKLLARVTHAWRTGAYGDARPTQRPEIRRRGDIAAARTVTLPKSDLELALPDDGFVWLAHGGADDEITDYLDRMAPALPDITLDIAYLPQQACSEVLASVLAGAKIVDEPPPLGVPLRWTAYPTILGGDLHERLICRDVDGSALIVGLLGVPRDAPASRDFGPYALIIQALVDAATP